MVNDVNQVIRFVGSCTSTAMAIPVKKATENIQTQGGGENMVVKKARKAIKLAKGGAFHLQI